MRIISRIFLLCFLAFPLMALANIPRADWAADVVIGEPVLAPSPFGALLDQFLSPGGVVSVLATLVALVGGLAWFTSRRKRLVALAAYHAFAIVEDIGNEIEGPDKFDKTAEYLKAVDKWMVAQGWRPLKPGEQEVAKLQAKVLHGAEVMKAKVAVAAAEAAKGSP